MCANGIEPEPMVVIPERVVKMLFIEGYFEEFWRLVQGGSTHVEAYQAMEEELEQYHLPNRYSSYESFKDAKRYYRQINSPIKFF